MAKEIHLLSCKKIKFNVFGRIIIAEGKNNTWKFFYPGIDGKRREVENLVASEINETELQQYLADVFHELATPTKPDVFVID